MDLIDILIRLLVALFMGGFTAATVTTAPSDGGRDEMAETVRSYTNIESVDVLVMESSPVQISLAVIGAQPDGCDFPVIVEQFRDGNTITVEIYRNVPINVMCTMMLIPYRETIILEGGFEPGSYTFRINDYVVERDI